MNELLINIAPTVFFIAFLVLAQAITDTIIEYKEYREFKNQ